MGRLVTQQENQGSLWNYFVMNKVRHVRLDLPACWLRHVRSRVVCPSSRFRFAIVKKGCGTLGIENDMHTLHPAIC